MATAIILRSSQMGEGDPALGEKILGTCLRKLGSFGDLEAIVLYNSGVRLVTKESMLAADLKTLEERGVDILPCGTCVEHYGLQDRLVVDRVSNMDEILAALREADKVVTL